MFGRPGSPGARRRSAVGRRPCGSLESLEPRSSSPAGRGRSPRQRAGTRGGGGRATGPQGPGGGRACLTRPPTRRWAAPRGLVPRPRVAHAAAGAALSLRGRRARRARGLAMECSSAASGRRCTARSTCRPPAGRPRWYMSLSADGRPRDGRVDKPSLSLCLSVCPATPQAAVDGARPRVPMPPRSRDVARPCGASAAARVSELPRVRSLRGQWMAAVPSVRWVVSRSDGAAAACLAARRCHCPDGRWHAQRPRARQDASPCARLHRCVRVCVRLPVRERVRLQSCRLPVGSGAACVPRVRPARTRGDARRQADAVAAACARAHTHEICVCVCGRMLAAGEACARG